MVKIFVKPNCPDCDKTKAAFAKSGVEFETEMLKAETIAEFKARGHRRSPIVVTENDEWSGFQPSKISAYVSSLDDSGLWD